MFLMLLSFCSVLINNAFHSSSQTYDSMLANLKVRARRRLSISFGEFIRLADVQFAIVHNALQKKKKSSLTIRYFTSVKKKSIALIFYTRLHFFFFFFFFCIIILTLFNVCVKTFTQLQLVDFQRKFNVTL